MHKLKEAVNIKNNFDSLAKLLDLFALLVYVFMVLNYILQSSRMNFDGSLTMIDMNNYCIYICIIIALIKIYVYWDNSPKKALCVFAVLALAVIFRNIGYVDYVFLIAPMAMFFNSDFEDICKVYAIFVFISLFTIFILAVSGEIVNYTYIPADRDTITYSLGFTHHSTFMVDWMMVVFACLYIFRNSKAYLGVIAIIVILSGFIYKYTDSNSAAMIIFPLCFLLAIETLLGYKLDKIVKRINNILCKILLGTPIYVLVITVVGVLFYNKYQRTIIDNTFISRYALLCEAVEVAGVKLPYTTVDSSRIGADGNWNWLLGYSSTEYGGGDIFYGNEFIKGGLLLIGIIFLIQMVILYKAYKQKDTVLMLVCAAVDIYACTAPGLSEIWASLFNMVLFANIEEGINE